MEKKFKIIALLPLFIILFFSFGIYLIRYLDEMNQYGRNLSFALPVLGIIYLFIIYYFLLRRENLSFHDIGLMTNRMKLTASIILGFTGGIFFFMIYFGAHPNRGLPAWPDFIAFNIYFLFVSLTEELVFRVWAMNSFRKVYSGGRAIMLSALVYMIASLATVGRDLSSVVAGRVDLFLIIETIVRTFFIGLILAAIYALTKTIYGNLFFITISNIPILYEIEGPAFQSNPISAAISTIGFIIFIVLLFIHIRFKTKIAVQPLSEREMVTS